MRPPSMNGEQTLPRHWAIRKTGGKDCGARRLRWIPQVGAIDHPCFGRSSKAWTTIDKNFGSVTMAPRSKSTSKRSANVCKLR